MKKFFTTDIPTKILSLVIAVFLWVYLVVLLNPQIETTITNIPISFSDHANLTKNGYVITNETVNSVTLKLRGSRNMLANVNKNNISAYIDLSGCSNKGTYSLPVHVRLPYDELSIIDKNPYNVTVNIDKITSYNFELELMPEGMLKENYVIDQIESTIKEINVKGPDELVRSIDKAVVKFDVSGIDADFSEKAKVVLLNNRGEIIESHLLTIDNSVVTVNGTVLYEKTVPINYDSINVPEGFEISSVSPMQITLRGIKDNLLHITELPLKGHTFGTDEMKADVEIDYPDGVIGGVRTVHVTVKKISENTEGQQNTNEDNNQ